MYVYTVLSSGSRIFGKGRSGGMRDRTPCPPKSALIVTVPKHCTRANTNQYLIIQFALKGKLHLESVACSHLSTKVRIIQAASPKRTTMFCGVLRLETGTSTINKETVQVEDFTYLVR